MKDVKRLIALTLAILMLTSVLASCKKNVTDNPAPDTTPEEITFAAPILPTEGQTVYNIVYALATIPPVLSAIECIASGYETYAIVERGKTYSGIDKLEYFHNSGFNTGSNESLGLSEEKLNAMTEQVKALNTSDPDAFFVFYAQDGTALSCAAIAANAGVPADRFHVYMCEDGTGAYVALRELLAKPELTPYQSYKELAADAKAKYDSVMAKTDNKPSDPAICYNIKLAFGLAALPNFTYYSQDKEILRSCLTSASADNDILLCTFGFSESASSATPIEYKLNFKFGKISEGIAKLTEEQRRDYLVLMYGDYYEDTYKSLTRTERAGEAAPAKKLVYIGARHSFYPLFATDEANGIGGLKDGDSVPESYAKLDQKYKSPLLFATEADYTLFLSIINSADAYSADITDEAKSKVRVSAFNLYLNYMYSLKFAYALYGEEYDIIIKGHPREVLGASGEWGTRYTVTYGENQTYCFDSLLDSLLLSFHASDSTGKYIGTVPYGTAAENLAYLGVEVSICGLPSSTYSGYDTDVDVLFVMSMTNESIDGDTSQVKDRFLAGNLTYKDGDEEKTCVFYNTGNTYKYAAQICKSAGDEKNAKMYEDLYAEWLTANRAGASDTDDQGFAKGAK